MTLADCRQTSDESVIEYYGRLNTIWKELVLFAQVPKCSCGLCKYNIAGQVATIRDADYLHHFLIGLDKPYEADRAQLLAQTPLPDVDEAYQRVINTERLRRDKEGRGNVMTFKVESREKTRYDDKIDRFCNHCKRLGHDEHTCYQLHGFPEWWDHNRRGGRISGRSDSRGGRGSRGGRTYSGGNNNHGGGSSNVNTGAGATV